MTNYRVASVWKALRVLDVFEQPPHEFSIKELCDHTGYSPNQVFRIIQTLLECGYVRDSAQSGKYRLAWRVFGLTLGLMATDALFNVIREPLVSVHEQLGHTVSVLVPDGESATVGVSTLHHESPLLISEITDQRNEHLHAGASGHVLLASFPDERVAEYLALREPLKTFTRFSPSTPDDVWKTVRKTRERGFAVSIEEVAIGMYGMAVPILERSGNLAAVITVAAPVAEAGRENQARHLEVLKSAAKEISNGLGFTGAQTSLLASESTRG